jgi:hypothetical protein
MVCVLERSAADLVSMLGARDRELGIDLCGIGDAVEHVVEAMGYEPGVVLKAEERNPNLLAAINLAPARVAFGHTLMYVPPFEVEADMPEGTLKALEDIKKKLDVTHAERATSSATRGAIGGNPDWQQFDSAHSTASVRIYCPRGIITRKLLAFASRNKKDPYRLGFFGGTADKHAPPAPAAMEEAVDSMCALFPEWALADLVPFSFTLAKSLPDPDSAHHPHRDPSPYHGIMGLGIYGVADLSLHHPSPGVAPTTHRLEPHSAYFMRGQDVSLCKHSVSPLLTEEGRCVFIVRLITKRSLGQIQEDMENAGQDDDDDDEEEDDEEEEEEEAEEEQEEEQEEEDEEEEDGEEM